MAAFLLTNVMVNHTV